MKNKISQNNKKYTRAFSLIEILIAIAIMLVIAGVSVTSLLNWRREKTIDSASDIVLSVLQGARNLTVNAYQGNQYGVYFGENDRVISFTGTTYNPSDVSNIVTLLPAGEIISTSTLGTTIVFQKFSGGVLGSGSVAISDKNNASTTRTILIDISGAVSQKK